MDIARLVDHILVDKVLHCVVQDHLVFVVDDLASVVELSDQVLD